MKTFISPISNFLSSQFEHFERNDLFPETQHLSEALTIFFSWSVPAFLFVWWSSTYFPEVQFYKDAIDEGLGPHLWQVVGSFGLFSRT